MTIHIIAPITDFQLGKYSWLCHSLFLCWPRSFQAIYLAKIFADTSKSHCCASEFHSTNSDYVLMFICVTFIAKYWHHLIGITAPKAIEPLIYKEKKIIQLFKYGKEHGTEFPCWPLSAFDDVAIGPVH